VVNSEKTIFQLVESDGDRLRAKKELKRPFIMVMEFVEGVDFEHLGEKELLFLSGENGKNGLRKIGRLVGLDMFINNWDRLPVVWQNDGNLGNIFIQVQDSKCRIVGLDQAVTCIHTTVNNIGYKNYLDRVKTFFEAVVTSPDKESVQVKKVRELLQTFTGFDITEKGTIEIQMGIIETVLKLSEEFKMEDLVNLKEDLNKWIEQDWEQVWKKMIDLIYLDFFNGVLQLFIQYSEKFHTILSQEM